MSKHQTQAALPKAVLYCWPTSVWSTVPRLFLHEKGYDDQDYHIKLVDLTKGENFNPSYLKINMNGTIPTLVVPMIETIVEDGETRYRSLRDTISICNFLDRSRNIGNVEKNSARPAPSFGPATIEAKAESDTLIELVHMPKVDPNFLDMTALDKSELQSKLSGAQGAILFDRREALKRFIDQVHAENVLGFAKDQSPGATTWNQKVARFLEEKTEANETLLAVFTGDAGEEALNLYFDASRDAWTREVPNVFKTLEESLKGPYALGDYLSMADFHIIGWLTRIVSTKGGAPDAHGLDVLEPYFGTYKIGPVVRAFWESWIERESFQKVYKGDFFPNLESQEKRKPDGYL